MGMAERSYGAAKANLALLEKRMGTEGSSIFYRNRFEIFNRLFGYLNVGDYFRFEKLDVRVVVRLMTLLLHHHEYVPKILHGLWKFRHNRRMFAGVFRGSMF